MSQLFEDKISIAMFVEEIIHETIHDVVRASREKLRFNCPICGETTNKRRGWFNLREATYVCYNGGCPAEESMTGLWFASVLRDTNYGMICAEYIKWCGGDDEETREKREVDFNKPEPKPDKVEIEDNWVDLPKSVEAYCTQRGLFSAPYSPPNWELYYDLETKRLVIPWLKDGQIEYYQKRKLISSDDGPKYLYPVDIKKPVFNLDRVDPDFPYIYMLEGALDGIFIKNGVSIGGINPTEYQLNLIKERFPTHQLVIVMDNCLVDKSAYNNLIGTSKPKKIGMLDKYPFSFRYFSWKLSTQKDVNEEWISGNKNFTDKDWLLERTLNAIQMKLYLNNLK